MDAQAKLDEAFNTRVEKLNDIDMAFLEGCAKPTVVLAKLDTTTN